jgi:hypothetical protein
MYYTPGGRFSRGDCVTKLCGGCVIAYATGPRPGGAGAAPNSSPAAQMPRERPPTRYHDGDAGYPVSVRATCVRAMQACAPHKRRADAP